MYERSYGYRYDRDRPTKQDAAMIRADIKALTKAGMLPADWTTSVRYRTFAGGCSIDVRGVSPRPIYACDPRTHEPQFHPQRGEYVYAWVDKLTLEAKAVHDALDDLVHAYNHDGSDLMTDYFDVKFYGSANVETAAGVPEWVDRIRLGDEGSYPCVPT